MNRLAALRSAIVHHRNAIDHDGVVVVRESEIVGRRKRLLAQIGEEEPRHAMRRARHVQDAALDRNVARPADRVAGQLDPGRVERGVGSRVGGHQPHPDAGELLEPEVGARIEPQHVHVLRDLGDEGQEQRPVQPALVEIVRRDVGGRHHDGAELEQPGEQPPQDHRVGDVGDVKLVEAQQPGLVEDRLRGQRRSRRASTSSPRAMLWR